MFFFGHPEILTNLGDHTWIFEIAYLGQMRFQMAISMAS